MQSVQRRRKQYDHISREFSKYCSSEISELDWFHGASPQICQWSVKLSHSMWKTKEKKKKERIFSLSIFSAEKSRDFFLPVCWHCLSLKFSKQPSETHLRFWHKTSYFTHKKVDDILQLISEYTWVWEMSLFMKCEKKKKTCLSWWIHLIRFWQHVHDQNVCYWIICSNWQDVIISLQVSQPAVAECILIPVDLKLCSFVTSHCYTHLLRLFVPSI